MSRIPITGPSITEKEVAFVTEAVRNGWFGNARRYVDQFEREFADYAGRTFALALPSCTSALHLCLVAAGVGPGDEVIVPESTWIGTAAPITYLGATPVFADIETDSWCMDTESVQSRITDRTKAVITVDLYGATPDMDSLGALCADVGIPLVEDAAQAIGTTYRGRRAGSFGTASTFSFGGTKTLTTGEGGMLLTDDKAFVERARWVSAQAHKPGTFWNMEVGYKYAMSNMQAALGLAQLQRVDELVSGKQEIFGWYRSRLAGVDGLELNPCPAEVENSYWMVTVIPDDSYDVDKAELIEALNADEITARPFFHPLSSLPAYGHLPSSLTGPTDNPVAYRLGRAGINLPSGFDMTQDSVDRVCTSLEKTLQESRRPAGVR